MKETVIRTVENLSVRAKFVPTTLNEDSRTIDVIFATGTPVRMFNWEDGAVDEILSFKDGEVRMDRLLNGAPVLDNHDRSEGTESVLGVVESASIVDGEGVATLRFSKREDITGTWQDIKDGILRGVSVGYKVYTYEITKEEGKVPIYRAIDWEPYEISIAPVPADVNSQVRTQQDFTKENKKPINIKMTPEEKTASDLAIAENQRKEKALQEAAIVGERNRVSDITDVVRKANLENTFAEKLIKDGISVDEARSLVIDEIAKVNERKIDATNTVVKVGVESKEKVRKGMEDAIEHRANPTIKLSEQGSEFRGMSLIDMASHFVSESGVKTTNLSKREIAVAALGLDSTRGYMSSSDFPTLLGNTVNRTLRRAYELQEPTFQNWAQKGSFNDFRQKTVIQLGDVTKMSQIIEGGEYKHGKTSEAYESYKANKYGIIIPLTWEAIVNDDLSAFNRIPSSVANNARQLQADVVYSILSANAALTDTVALFHATHGNLAGTGSVISVASLQAARTAMRTQKSSQGYALNLVPKYLVVGPTSELAAYQFTSTNYVSTKNSDINPVYNAALTVIVDARITDTSWYVMADPAMIDTIEYSFLQGEGELFTEQRTGWDVDGMELKARMVFNAKAVDFRGMYKNAGA